MLLLAPAAAPLLAAAALTHPAAPVPASAWAGLGYAGVISMFAASLAWYHGLAAGGAPPGSASSTSPKLGGRLYIPLRGCASGRMMAARIALPAAGGPIALPIPPHPQS
jgi:drug/metabolite transporter (DMT)-like permease